MRLLDRYIARQFLVNALLLLVLLFSFVVMVDVSINLSRFYKTAGNLAGEAVGGGGGESGGFVRRMLITALLIANLWWPRLLSLFNSVSGLVMIGAMGFTFTQLVRQRELVAMLAGGVSLWRAARPVLLMCVLISLVQVLNQELVIPRIAPLLTRDPGSSAEREVDAFPVKLTADGERRVVQALRFRPGDGVLESVNIWERSDRGQVTRRITAERAVYEHDQNGPGGSWRLEGARVVPLVFRRPNAGGTVPIEAAPERLVTDLSPTTLLINQFATISQSLSWRQIAQVLATPGVRPETIERLERVGLGRISTIVCTLLAVVICLPFYLTREPRNMVGQSLKAAPLAILATLGAVLGTTAPVPGMPAAAAVFIPVAILLPLAIAAWTSIRT